MYIDQMEISGFGLYSGLTLNLNQGLNIILGQNEAGKSTCHEFVRFMLYGPATGSGSRTAPRYEPLRGGEHGGSLELVTLAGQSFRLSRKGKTPTKFTLVDENMEELGPEMLAHILGQAGPELYNTVFAFSIKELYDLNALDPSKTPDVLCGINFGLGAISISGVLKDLEQRRGKIYAPRGSNPLLNDLFKEFRQVQEKIMPLRRNLEEYAALDKQLAALAEESASLQPELDRLEAEQSKFKTAQRLFPLWQERKNLEETLHALPSTSQEGFLPDDPARLEHIEARQKNNLAALTRVQTRLGEITATLAAPKSNPVLLEVDELLADLTDRRGQYRDSFSLIPQKKTRLGEIKNRIETILASLDQNWTRNRAMSFNFSSKAGLEQLLADVQQSGREAALAEQERDSLLQEAADLAAPDSLADLPSSETLRANKRDLSELCEQERRLGYALQMEIFNSRDRRRTKQYGLLLLGVYFALLGGIMAGIWASTGLGLALGLGIMAVFAALTPALPKRPDKPVTSLQAQLAEMAAQKEAPCAALGISGVNDADFAAAEERINLMARIEQLKARAATESAKAEVHGNNFAGLRTKLREFLINLGINPDCAAEEVRGIMDRIQELQPLMAQESALKEETELLERHMDDFSNGLGLLVSRTSIAWVFDERGVPDPLATLTAVENAVQTAKTEKLEQAHLKRQVEELKAEQDRHTKEGAALQAELLAFLNARGVASPNELQPAFAQWQKVQDLKARASQLHKEIAAGAGERQDEVFHLLGYISPEKLNSQIANLTRHIEEHTRQAAAQHQQQGKIRQQRDALVDERHFEDLRFREEALKQEMAEAARDWAVTTLARHAVEESKTFFEQERQPEVMRAASDWFKTITLGEYAGINPGSEPGALAVLTSKKEPRLVTQLSRGTREQLFLAMRLALIRDRSRDAEPLPVLMDDILVNFDPKRAKAAAAAVLSLAGDHQILFFTCHPHIAHMFEDLALETRRPVGAFVIEDGRVQS